MVDARKKYAGFVEKMLKSAETKEEPKPNSSSDVDPKELEPIMKDIQNKIQQKSKK